jgi:adenylosuccinate synthase
MFEANVVIGANWGDEGKGLMTDHFSCNDSIVVRFNGGAQAGHTVVTPEGVRHVFHHVGSGTFKGASTYLSKYFIVNPILFFDEYEILTELGYKPKVFVDLECLVTTHYDMMINQMVEESRGVARHGSCGAGINETIKRNQHAEFKLATYDLWFKTEREWTAALLAIQTKWVPYRLKELGIDITPEWQDRINSTTVLDAFLERVEYFTTHIRMPESRLFDQDNAFYVFEGAQGLLLDEDHRFFPYVTHSHTGLRNVINLAMDFGVEKLSVTYVTRAYATRHGAGPFPGEDISVSYEDATNVPNDWQGTLRFGNLNIDLLVESIKRDMKTSTYDLKVDYNVAITCLDQVADDINVILDGKVISIWREHLRQIIKERLHIPVRYLSYGPTHETIRTI